MDNQETRALLDTRHRTKTNKRRKNPQKTKKDVQRGPLPPSQKKTYEGQHKHGQYNNWSMNAHNSPTTSQEGRICQLKTKMIADIFNINSP